MDQAGVPIEFNNVCSMMRWFQKKPNVNIKTQIIGFSAEKLEKIYPIDCKYFYFHILYLLGNVVNTHQQPPPREFFAYSRL